MKTLIKNFEQFVNEAWDISNNYEPGVYSNCCGAPVIHGGVCTECGEYCDVEDEYEEFPEDQVNDPEFESDYEDFANEFDLNENDFGGNNFKKAINRENKEKSEILDELINEISRVRDLLNGTKKGPLRKDYLNKILNFYKELEMDEFDYKDETK